MMFVRVLKQSGFPMAKLGLFYPADNRDLRFVLQKQAFLHFFLKKGLLFTPQILRLCYCINSTSVQYKHLVQTSKGAIMAAKKKAKKTASKKKVAAKKAVKSIKDPMTKSQLYTTIAENTGLKKKDVVAVFDELNTLINGHVKRNAAGIFTMPGLMKIKVVRKPATKARKGINPFTGEPTVFKAKPARNVVKVQPLKALKEMAK
jgi:nucleoid DNA-binding protein